MRSKQTIRVDGHEYVASSDDPAVKCARWWLTVSQFVWLRCDDGRYVVLSKAHLERAEIIIEEIDEHD